MGITQSSMMKYSLGIDRNDKRWELQEMGITQSSMMKYSLGIIDVNDRVVNDKKVNQ